jgi:hypothetical protein
MVKVPAPDARPEEVQQYLEDSWVQETRRQEYISAFTVAKNRLRARLLPLIPKGFAEEYSKAGPALVKVFFRSNTLALEVASLYPPRRIEKGVPPPNWDEFEDEHNMLTLIQRVHGHLFRLALIKRTDHVASVLLVLCSGMNVPKPDHPMRRQLEWQASEFGVAVFFRDVTEDATNVIAQLASGQVVHDDFEDAPDE